MSTITARSIFAMERQKASAYNNNHDTTNIKRNPIDKKEQIVTTTRKKPAESKELLDGIEDLDNLLGDLLHSVNNKPVVNTLPYKKRSDANANTLPYKKHSDVNANTLPYKKHSENKLEKQARHNANTDNEADFPPPPPPEVLHAPPRRGNGVVKQLPPYMEGRVMQQTHGVLHQPPKLIPSPLNSPPPVAKKPSRSKYELKTPDRQVSKDEVFEQNNNTIISPTLDDLLFEFDNSSLNKTLPRNKLNQPNASTYDNDDSSEDIPANTPAKEGSGSEEIQILPGSVAQKVQWLSQQPIFENEYNKKMGVPLAGIVASDEVVDRVTQFNARSVAAGFCSYPVDTVYHSHGAPTHITQNKHENHSSDSESTVSSIIKSPTLNRKQFHHNFDSLDDRSHFNDSFAIMEDPKECFPCTDSAYGESMRSSSSSPSESPVLRSPTHEHPPHHFQTPQHHFQTPHYLTNTDNDLEEFTHIEVKRQKIIGNVPDEEQILVKKKRAPALVEEQVDAVHISRETESLDDAIFDRLLASDAKNDVQKENYVSPSKCHVISNENHVVLNKNGIASNENNVMSNKNDVINRHYKTAEFSRQTKNSQSESAKSSYVSLDEIDTAPTNHYNTVKTILPNNRRNTNEINVQKLSSNSNNNTSQEGNLPNGNLHSEEIFKRSKSEEEDVKSIQVSQVPPSPQLPRFPRTFQQQQRCSPSTHSPAASPHTPRSNITSPTSTLPSPRSNLSTPRSGSTTFSFDRSLSSDDPSAFSRSNSCECKPAFNRSISSDSSNCSDTLSNPSSVPGSPGKFSTMRRRFRSRGNSSPSSPQELFMEVAKYPSIKFEKDTKKSWYRPTITREEAVTFLLKKAPGTFVVRDSQSYKGAFGLAVKVETPPPTVIEQADKINLEAELVRHFLIEPCKKGVRLKGSNNEPAFPSLVALVYQHTLIKMALPIALVIDAPSNNLDSVDGAKGQKTVTEQDLLVKGAACSLVYMGVVKCESLTGDGAVQYAVNKLTSASAPLKSTVVNIKVNQQGITYTDINRKVFFRRHFPMKNVLHCGVDPKNRLINIKSIVPECGKEVGCFGVVVRKTAKPFQNECHICAELDPEQPSSAVINFIHKAMRSAGKM